MSNAPERPNLESQESGTNYYLAKRIVEIARLNADTVVNLQRANRNMAIAVIFMIIAMLLNLYILVINWNKSQRKRDTNNAPTAVSIEIPETTSADIDHQFAHRAILLASSAFWAVNSKATVCRRVSSSCSCCLRSSVNWAVSSRRRLCPFMDNPASDRFMFGRRETYSKSTFIFSSPAKNTKQSLLCSSLKLRFLSGSVQSISMGVMPSLFTPTSLRISSWMLGESSAIFNLSPLGVRVAFVRFHYSTPFGRGVFIIGKGGAL